MLFQPACHALRQVVIRYNRLYLPHIGYMAETALVEFRRVEYGDGLLRLRYHRLVEHRLLQTRRRDARPYRERVHTQEEFVVAEVAQCVHRQRTYR